MTELSGPEAVKAGGWVRTETRLVLPHRVSDCLDEVLLSLEEEEDFQDFRGGKSIEFSSIDWAKFSPALDIPELPDDFAFQVGISPEDCDFVVSIHDGALIETKVAMRCPLPDMPSGAWEIPQDLVSSTSWAGNTLITLSIILRQDRPDAAPDEAEHAGSWLARKEFRFRKPLNLPAFEIKSATEDWLRSRHLPTDTSYVLVWKGEDFNVPMAELPGVVEIYAHEKLIDALSPREETRVGDALVSQILADIVESVLETSLEQSGDELEPGSIADVLLQRVAKAAGISKSDVLTRARDTQKTTLKAMVQSAVGLNEALTSAVKRGA